MGRTVSGLILRRADTDQEAAVAGVAWGGPVGVVSLS